MGDSLVIHKDRGLYLHGDDEEFTVKQVGRCVPVGNFTEILVMKEVEGMKLWKSIVLFTLVRASSFVWTVRIIRGARPS
jgi:hypothetical protein